MNVSCIELLNFTCHDKAVLELPEAGIVLVSGDNGAGKSSFIEAVAWALWGKTLRGADPSRGEKIETEVKVTTDAVGVQRVRKAGRSSLNWVAVNCKRTEYETATKAQEALCQVIGEFDVWRRACVFSSQDAAHFTLATDAERKRLLESILGLDRFDSALERCRTDLRRAELEEARHRGAVNTLSARLEEAGKRLADAEATLVQTPTAGNAALLEKKKANLSSMLSACDREVEALRTKLREADRAGGINDAKVAELSSKLARLSAAYCPTCEQEISQAKRDGIGLSIAMLKQNAEQARRDAQASTVNADAAIADLTSERGEIHAKYQEIQAQVYATGVHRAARDRAEKLRAEALAGVTKLSNELLAAQQSLVEQGADLGVLVACERVLGMRGVRAHILSRALGGLEAAANAWLARLAGFGLRLKLSPYSEKKSGGVSDAISLEVEGAGGGSGYRGSSGGERRRMDVALMLALSEVSQAAHGQRGGTLFFDEVFDALDGEGREAVASAVQDLAQERAVVVVTHSEALAGLLDPVKRVVVGCAA